MEGELPDITPDETMVDISDRGTGTGGTSRWWYLTDPLRLTASSQGGDTLTELCYLTGGQNQHAIIIQIFPRLTVIHDQKNTDRVLVISLAHKKVDVLLSSGSLEDPGH